MRRTVTRAAEACLRDERGVALVVALGFLLLLSLGFATSIVLTSAGARHAFSSNADQKAYALAEEGVNNAVAVIFSDANRALAKSVDCTAGNEASYATYETLLPSRTTARPEGRVTWSGTFVCDPAGPYWRVESLAVVTNPTGGGAGSITRKATARIPLDEDVEPSTTTVWTPVTTEAATTVWVPSETTYETTEATTVATTVYDLPGYSDGSFMYSWGDFSVSGGSNLLQQAIISDGNFTQSGGSAQVQASASVVSVKGNMSVSNWVGMGPATPPTLISALKLADDPTTPWNDVTVARVTSIASFPTSAIGGGVTIAGMIFVDNEYMTYNSVGTSTAVCGTPLAAGQGCFVGLTRGFLASRPAAEHSVGAAVDGRIARVAVRGTCNGCTTTTSGGVHAISWTSGASANLIDTSRLRPTFDVANVRNNAALGPAHLPLATSPSCPFNLTTTTDPYWKNTTFNLTPAASYVCKGSGGSVPEAGDTAELSWDNTTKELKVRGVVYLPGNVSVSQHAYYTTFDGTQASATIYVAGSWDINGIKLCGLRVTASIECDTRNWNPNTGHHLAFVSPTLPRATGYTTQPSHSYGAGGSAQFQGFLYTDGTFTRSGGTGYVSGTVMAASISTSGGASAAPAPGVFSLPVGVTGGPRVVTHVVSTTRIVTETSSTPVATTTSVTTSVPSVVSTTSTVRAPGAPRDFGG